MARYEAKLSADIARWLEAGLIDRQTADRLLVDVGHSEARRLSFGAVLAIMAAVLVGAAILLFIAANWEAVPRIARVIALFLVIAGGYVGGAVLKSRGHDGLGEGLYIVGCAAFGASIALIGQMYHMSGDERAAILIWCLGTLLAAAALRSSVLTAASAVLAVAWLLVGEGFGQAHGPDWRYLGLGALIWAVSYWTQSAASRHLLLLSLVLFAVLVGLHGDPLLVGAATAVVSATVFLVASWAHEGVERVAKLGGPYPAHPLVGFLTGMAMVQIEVGDLFWPMFIASLVAFAGIVAALLLRGRQSALMRWIAYAAFVVELGVLYTVTLGTMMETSALFFFSGVSLSLAAWLIARVEKRMSRQGGQP